MKVFKKKNLELEEEFVDSTLKVINLYKNYSEIKAVNDVTFDAKINDIIAIIGQNGAGKSTLLGMIAGYIPYTNGFIHCSSQRFCPQENVLWENLTVLEHIKLYASLNGTEDLSALSKSKLDQQAHRQVCELSGGMKRRLMLAISIIGNPDVILLDEPTTGLDPIVRKAIWKFINFVRLDKLVIFTSHSMEEVEFLAQNVMVMDKGSVIHFCSVLELKRIYSNSYEFAVFFKDWNKFIEEFVKEFREVQVKRNDKIAEFIIEKGILSQKTAFWLDKSKWVERWSLTQESLGKVFYGLSSRD